MLEKRIQKRWIPHMVLHRPVAGLPVLCLGLPLHSLLSCGSPGFQMSWRKVEPGMTREEVVEMLGEPDDESPEFHLSQYESFEKEYERAEQSGSEYYCFWYRGIDVTYAVGFDGGDRVTMKALGGT